MTLLTGAKASLADKLYEAGAVKFKFPPDGFKLKLHDKNPDAPLSPIYLNLRTARHPKNPGPLTDEIMGLIGYLFGELGSLQFDVFADIPDAGEPFGNQLDRIYGGAKRRLRLRKIIHADGTREIAHEIEGTFNEGDVCLLVDELITQADSKFEAIDVVETAGLVVMQVLVLVDRMQGGKQQLAHHGFELISVFTLGELLSHYVDRGFITSEQAHTVRDYLAANTVTV